MKPLPPTQGDYFTEMRKKAVTWKSPKATLHFPLMPTMTHIPTLKSPLSMISIILYCWLMSFSSTRFLSAFSWSFLLVSNSRLSERRGQEDATWGTKEASPGPTDVTMGTDVYSRAFNVHNQPTEGGYRSPGWSRASACEGPGPSRGQRRSAPGARCTRSSWPAEVSREMFAWKHEARRAARATSSEKGRKKTKTKTNNSLI